MMRIRLLFLISFLGLVEVKAKEAYAVLSADKNVLSFYDDDDRSSREGTTYDLNVAGKSPAWYGSCGSVTSVVFDESFAEARPVSCLNWFNGMSKLIAIKRIEHLNTSMVTNMHAMFMGCSSLISLDLHSFDTSNVTNMGSMFEDCNRGTEILYRLWFIVAH